jgi:tetratricopeptide (TPR) repeat protein
LTELRDIQRLLDVGLAGAHYGRPGESRAIFEGLLIFDPTLLAAKAGLALTYLVVNDFDRAQSLLKEILTVDPNHEEALVFLGLVGKLAGLNEQASEILAPIKTGSSPAASLARELVAWNG